LMNGQMAALRYLRDPDSADSGTVLGHLLKLASEQVQIAQLLSSPEVEGIILRHACPALFAKSFIPGTLETWAPLSKDPSDLTISLYGRLLDALSPPVHPQPGTEASGSMPCEFSYAHL